MMLLHTTNHTRGRYTHAARRKKLNILCNLVLATFLKCFIASFGIPMTASGSSNAAESASERVDAFCNLDANARRINPAKFVISATLRTTGSTFVYLFAAGVEMLGDRTSLISSHARPNETTRSALAASPQHPAGHGCINFSCCPQ